MTSELIWLSATELLEAYRGRQLSPVEVTTAVLERIEALNGELNCFCLVDADGALDQARASEQRWQDGTAAGRLDGVPTMIKDLLLTKGWPTLRGSRTSNPDGPWDIDAPAPARLREHGAVLIGKTTTPEFGWKGVTDSPLTGITRNPWDRSKTPGGSSGGSAAAVACGMGPLAVGTDGGGSIRIPAGFTGIFGHKPSFGRVPAWPPNPFGTVAHVGPMTRTVSDAALMLTVMAEPDTRDWYALPYDGRDYLDGLDSGIKGLKIAYSRTLGYIEVDAEIAGLIDAAVDRLKDLGAEVIETDPGFDDPAEIFRTMWWSSAHAMLSGLNDDTKALLDPDLAAVLDEARRLTIDNLLAITAARQVMGANMRIFMADYDLLVTPSLPIPAFDAGLLSPTDETVGKWTNWTPFSFPFNLTQQPAASVPCGFTGSGLPAGLQIVGRMHDDATVLRAARAYEQVHGWSSRRPPV